MKLGKGSLLLCLTLLLLALFALPALAADNSQSYSFDLSVDGASAIQAKTGDEITVSFVLRRTDSSADWAMYAWQTEIAYDANAFQVVADSLSAPSGVGSSLHVNGRTGKVYFNDFSLSKTGDSYPAELDVCSFKLKVVGSGDYSIRNTNFKVSTAGGADSYAATSSDLAVSIASVPASQRFSDVKAGSWYEDAVSFVVDRGLFAGTGNTTFSPEATMTRAMLVTVLWRLEGEPTVNSKASFNDVADGQWYSTAVAWAAANRIVEGYSSGLFGVNDNVTREQMAAILLRYASFKGYDLTKTTSISTYRDAYTVSSWALEAMSWANANGIISGTSATTLSPAGTASRAQVATMLMRFVNTFTV